MCPHLCCVGNAFFLRVMHADVMPSWKNMVIITSEFQMQRTMAIFNWVFSLSPVAKGKYHLSYVAVTDEGAVPQDVLLARREREKISLQNFLTGSLFKTKELSHLHKFVYLNHNAYNAVGMLSKEPFNSSTSVAGTY